MNKYYRKGLDFLIIVLVLIISFSFISCENSVVKEENTSETESSELNISDSFVEYNNEIVIDEVDEDNTEYKKVLTNFSDILDSTYSSSTISRREWVIMMLDVFGRGEIEEETEDIPYTFSEDFEYAYEQKMIDERDFVLSPYEDMLRRDAGDSLVPYLGYGIKEYEFTDYEDMDIQTHLGTLIYYNYFFTDEDGNGNPYEPVLREDIDIVKPELQRYKTYSGKLIYSFGDSIMAGDGNDGVGYAKLIADKYGMTSKNFSKGGATFGYFEDRSQICEQIKKSFEEKEKPDIILINGGINDARYEKSGSVNISNFDYKANGNKTFVAGMEYAIGELLDNYKDSIMVYNTTHKTNTIGEKKEKEYADTSLVICDKWEFPVVNLYYESGFDPENKEDVDKYTSYEEDLDGGDTVHPISSGYMKFYLPLIMDKMDSEYKSKVG